MKYLWHRAMFSFHYRMCYIWNFSYHYRKWKHHGRRCFELKGLDYDKALNRE